MQQHIMHLKRIIFYSILLGTFKIAFQILVISVGYPLKILNVWPLLTRIQYWYLTLSLGVAFLLPKPIRKI